MRGTAAILHDRARRPRPRQSVPRKHNGIKTTRDLGGSFPQGGASGSGASTGATSTGGASASGDTKSGVMLQSIYQEIILDHYRHPHHRGLREPYDAEVHHVNPTCGDEVTVRVRLGGAGEDVAGDAANGASSAANDAPNSAASGAGNGAGDIPAEGDVRVSDVSYDALGCSISQASASVMTDLVIGKTVDEALAVGDAFLALMQARGDVEPDEDVLEDAVAFAGVAKYPARVKCALLGWMAWKDATVRALNGKAGQAS